MADHTIANVIETYLKLRRRKEVIEAETREHVSDIKAKLAKLEAWIQAKSDETGVKSFKTDAGTAFLTTSDFASVGNWEAVLAWVKKNNAWDLLAHGVNKKSARQYIEANSAVPDGVNFGSKISVSVRKAGVKVDA